MTKQVDEAVKNGAKLHLGGKPAQREGSFFEPTILTGITRDNPAYFEEFFGPVAQIYVVKDDDEAVKLANDSHYGLGGAVFSQDIDRAKRMASRIETGMVYINWLTDTAPELPFGGVKRSGFGRELSDLGIKEFCESEAGGGSPLSNRARRCSDSPTGLMALPEDIDWRGFLPQEEGGEG
ncbi:succinate-semialdehyde dehydrogenase [Klebsiella oxytoca]|nr:succinate-semialdehyde dehydrogenase [Klebsiella oxytoca]